MWYLVFIGVIFNSSANYHEPVIDSWHEFETVMDCFWAREEIMQAQTTLDGKQAVCIWKEKADAT